MRSWRRLGVCVALVASILLAPRAGAYTLFWASNDWTAGNLTQTFANVQSSGVDVRITITGDTAGDLAANFPDDRMTNSPLPDNRRALWLRIQDWETNANEAVTVTVQFFQTGTTTPTNILLTSLSAFDLDTHNANGDRYRDELRNWGGSSATNVGAFNILPRSSYATNSTAATFVIDNTNATTTITGKSAPWNDTTTYNAPQSPTNGFQRGTANLNFGANPIAEFHYTYGNARLTNSSGAFTGFNPTLQWTALGDIGFIGVPEPGTLAGLAVAGGVLIWLRRRMR